MDDEGEETHSSDWEYGGVLCNCKGSRNENGDEVDEIH